MLPPCRRRSRRRYTQVKYKDRHKLHGERVIRSASRDALEAHPAGYDSASQPLLAPEEIVAMLEGHGLVEVLAEAAG